MSFFHSRVLRQRLLLKSMDAWNSYWVTMNLKFTRRYRCAIYPIALLTSKWRIEQEKLRVSWTFDYSKLKQILDSILALPTVTEEHYRVSCKNYVYISHLNIFVIDQNNSMLILGAVIFWKWYCRFTGVSFLGKFNG